ncbi:Glycosyl_hydrolase family 25 protein [Hexamita inflata]|uniref:Glycosyl hydrolase family 25 protein n=1 Tax=Hexamita inflata TaxID=28002 RepID=A0AA86PAB9_9EUKA|nr:Glycosyl hydrolase family 25 protein [Hexamita inflata]
MLSIVLTLATRGFDVSYYQGAVSQDTFNCLYNNGYRFAIIQAQIGSTFNENAISDYWRAKQAGIEYVDFYIFPTTAKDARGQVRDTVNRLISEGVMAGMVCWTLKASICSMKTGELTSGTSPRCSTRCPTSWVLTALVSTPTGTSGSPSWLAGTGLEPLVISSGTRTTITGKASTTSRTLAAGTLHQLNNIRETKTSAELPSTETSTEVIKRFVIIHVYYHIHLTVILIGSGVVQNMMPCI